ncbi:MAG: AmmeMemoRadiSam system radical SAM enzyme [Candidatus Nanoarchaeia archaeon]|nr:AmmeMemoRadiSam system radical SAM enzyme [Candidatus Haiyanarchaeum thermophilum]MCW1303337.1 AmmeMemoRadiSam system radical SAM enzyme [Candidatus Haiyanarchaeum thermophilum]MCW1304081.1 AmmeMemoRadiSam system radical SAM enzyme [Candidatus Haiyanarchaeum thermophilum]MCW1306497.1 AmmeMemoRadiSam system radical SAM enzyme [Candidatus Haiyanarchaeum thermophilum]MCW1307551.1 AmmeMemoRadiSam system radical SAM enzyme [Candidatus Haiyanarchaeum thermophilum]
MKEALFYKRLNNSVRCELCPRHCTIKVGDVGYCRARKNVEGKLYSLVYGRPVAVNIDPIEKKPFYHFYPGSRALSIGTIGCNFSCKYCQNWEMSQARFEDLPYIEFPPERAVEEAIRYGCRGISYTYNEPTVFYEYTLATARLAKEKGLTNTYVTNGCIEERPLAMISSYLDAANIDLKGFDEKFYREVCGAELEWVLRSIKQYVRHNIWIELTNLVVPGKNDDVEEIKQMCEWIMENCGDHTPLHFSRFFPAYKMLDLPPTPIETLEKAWKVAKDVGLKYVYIGNVPGHPYDNTYCYSCGKLLIKRFGFEVLEFKIQDGRCYNCGAKIHVIGGFHG